ncbi:hypothetical protein CMI46_01910 [Candidatus Pacearchaeota archaeon]|nr:hypothetical protein [Candidatus Pacearchaeota archaeon]
MKNKKGFLRIIEAFLAILIIAGVMSFIYVNNIQKPRQEDLAYQLVRLSLKEISNDVDLRGNVLSINPFEDDDSSGFESDVQTPDDARLIAESIEGIIPPEFDFKFRVCKLEVACGLQNLPQKDVFSEVVSVSATLDESGCLLNLDDVPDDVDEREKYVSFPAGTCEFFPKKIRLFVWDKD